MNSERHKRDGQLPATVCIATSELVGLHKNGGLGTATTGLAALLAANSVKVTVVYTGDVESGTFEIWRSRYAAIGINLVWLSSVQSSRIAGPMAKFGWTKAWALFDHLRGAHFDVVHFNDTLGEGVYCFAAKKLGMAFQQSLLCLALHSPTEWILESNKSVPNWPGYFFFIAAERISIAASDVLWGPSQYLLNWITNKGYELPAQSLVKQYVIPPSNLFASADEAPESSSSETIDRVVKRTLKEIVFFGRLEERKGLRLFANVLTRLNDELTRREISVVFMGKSQQIDGLPSDQFIDARAKRWTFKWRIEGALDQQEATSYLRRNACLAVMSSPVDNSPCTVYEALQFGFPFIATRAGGIPELIHSEDRDLHLFDYSVGGLSKKLLQVLDSGIGAPRSALPIAERQDAWLSFHRNWLAYRSAQVSPGPLTGWGVVIENSSDDDAIEQTLASMRRELGKDVLATVILRRRVGEEFADTDDLSMVIDELNDVSAYDALRWMKEKGVGGLLVVRSGGCLSPGSGDIIRNMGRHAAPVIVPAIRFLNDGSILPPLSSPALTFLDHGSDIGGFIVTQSGLDDLLEEAFASIDRSRDFLGIVDFFHANSREILPMPQPLFVFEDMEATIAPRLNEVQQNLALSSMDRSSVFQMIGLGREYYRNYYQPQAERRRKRRRFIERYLPFLSKKTHRID